MNDLQKINTIRPIEKNGKDCWIAESENNRITGEKGNAELMRFHEQSLQDAVQALQQPKALRKYKSLILPMTQSDLEEYYARMDEFVSEQFAKYSADSYKGRRLFQLNFNVYPVSQHQQSDILSTDA